MLDTEKEICSRYEAELAAIAELDRAYYLNVTATPADRANYFSRQDHLEQVRARLYAELSTVRHPKASKPGAFWLRVNNRGTGQPVMSALQCTLAHDLNNYLGVVIGRCELLADSPTHVGPTQP